VVLWDLLRSALGRWSCHGYSRERKSCSGRTWVRESGTAHSPDLHRPV
jgi:hypothetical protein